LAVAAGSQIALLLVEHGANPNIKDLNGVTPPEKASAQLKQVLFDPGKQSHMNHFSGLMS
jgi:hypothetical protein